MDYLLHLWISLMIDIVWALSLNRVCVYKQTNVLSNNNIANYCHNDVDDDVVVDIKPTIFLWKEKSRFKRMRLIRMKIELQIDQSN